MNFKANELPISFLFKFLVDCVWSIWSRCSATCGDSGSQGRYKLTRAENRGNECQGKYKRKCNQIICPTN